jgi:PAS domain S-box-containing protein
MPQSKTEDTCEDLHLITEELYKNNLELVFQRRKTEQLLYSVSEAVLGINNKGIITVVNRVLEQMLGLKEDKIEGNSVDEMIMLRRENGRRVKLSSLCLNSTAKTKELDELTLYGNENTEYIVNIKTAAIENEGEGKEYLITMVDITREKELEQIKDDFLSVASHELRTPMTIIKSYLWMLQGGKYGKLSAKQDKYVDVAMHGTERLINLVNDMLNISRIEQGRMKFEITRTDIAEVVKETIEELKIRAKTQNIYLKSEILGEKSTKAYGDANKIKEIIVNLVGNSLKFTKQGGITLILEPQTESIKVSVVDTGTGISAEDQKALFTKFGRLDNSYTKVAESGGTGLGLHIVKLYIEAMGGKVGAESEGDGKGSTFWFTLTKSKKHTRSTQQKKKPTTQKTKPSKKIPKEKTASIAPRNQKPKNKSLTSKSSGKKKTTKKQPKEKVASIH